MLPPIPSDLALLWQGSAEDAWPETRQSRERSQLICEAAHAACATAALRRKDAAKLRESAGALRITRRQCRSEGMPRRHKGL